MATVTLKSKGEAVVDDLADDIKDLLSLYAQLDAVVPDKCWITWKSTSEHFTGKLWFKPANDDTEETLKGKVEEIGLKNSLARKVLKECVRTSIDYFTRLEFLASQDQTKSIPLLREVSREADDDSRISALLEQLVEQTNASVDAQDVVEIVMNQLEENGICLVGGGYRIGDEDAHQCYALLVKEETDLHEEAKALYQTFVRGRYCVRDEENLRQFLTKFLVPDDELHEARILFEGFKIVTSVLLDVPKQKVSNCVSWSIPNALGFVIGEGREWRAELRKHQRGKLKKMIENVASDENRKFVESFLKYIDHLPRIEIGHE